MFPRPDHVRSIRLRLRALFRRPQLRKQERRWEQCVLRPDGPFRVSRFFSVPGRRERQELVGRVRRFAPASAVPCIPRARLPLGRVRLELVQGFLRPDRFVREAVPVRLRAGPDSATFRAESKKVQ